MFSSAQSFANTTKVFRQNNTTRAIQITKKLSTNSNLAVFILEDALQPDEQQMFAQVRQKDNASSSIITAFNAMKADENLS